MWDKLQRFDRRWIFLAMAVAIVLPLLVPASLPFAINARVKALYDEVERIQPGQKVLLSLDYGPESAPEVHSFTQAFLRHLLERRAKVVVISLWYYILPMATAELENIIEGEYNARTGPFAARDPSRPPYRYGEDWVWMGFREGKEAVIQNMAQSFRTAWSADYHGTPAARLPILSGIDSLSDFRLVVDVSSGYPGAREYVQYATTRYPVRFASAVAMVMVTDVAPYYPQQMFSYVDGIRGSAEYEMLVGRPSLAASGVNVLTFGHLLIIIAILFGNVIYFMTRRKP